MKLISVYCVDHFPFFFLPSFECFTDSSLLMTLSSTQLLGNITTDWQGTTIAITIFRQTVTFYLTLDDRVVINGGRVAV